MPNILLGDDDEELTQLLQEYLHNHGIRCDCVHDGEAVIERLKSAMHDSAPYDLLVLDIMMPKIDGLSVLRQLPAISDIPVIMLTAKGEEIDRIIGLELGADDYIEKPYNPAELIARVKAHLRRYRVWSNMEAEKKKDSDQIVNGGLVLDKKQRVIFVEGEEVHLTATEYKILELLMAHPGQVFPAEQIYENVWQETADYTVENTVMVHIRHIREKVEIDAKKPRYVKVVWGIGYKMEKYGKSN